MAQAPYSPQRYRGFVLTAAGLQKLHERIKKLETQTRLRQSPRSLAERVQLSEPDGIHPVTVRKILSGENGVDKRSIQLIFQVLQLQLEEGDYAHAGLYQQPIERQIEIPIEASVKTILLPRSEDCNEAVDEPDLYGRVYELTHLNQAITTEHCRLVQILGMTGIGKTALATMLVRAVGSEFEFVIWKSLYHAPNVQTVLTSILQLLIRQGENVKLPTQVEELTGLLVEQLQNHRCLLVFDRFNSILCGNQHAGYCRPGYEAYSELLQVIAEVPHQSCLIITSREKLRSIGITEERYIRSLQLKGLLPSDCQRLLSNYHELVGSTDDWRSLVKQCNGNPLVLKMVTAYVQDYFNGRISDYLKYLKFEKSLFRDLRDFLKPQFDRLSPLEQELVYRLALYQQPISGSQFFEDITSSISHQHWLEGLDSLSRRSLLHRQENYFALDPMMKMYVNECLIEQQDNSLPKPKLKIVSNQHTIA